jgi:hypothetical protein
LKLLEMSLGGFVLFIVIVGFSIALPVFTYMAANPFTYRAEVVAITPFDNHKLIQLYVPNTSQAIEYFSVSPSCKISIAQNVSVSETLGAWWYWKRVPLHIEGC